MEDYLRQMLKEFESVSPLLKKNQPVDFMSLEYLDEFTGTTNRNFSLRMKKIKEMIRKKIIVLKYTFLNPIVLQLMKLVKILNKPLST